MKIIGNSNYVYIAAAMSTIFNYVYKIPTKVEGVVFALENNENLLTDKFRFYFPDFQS